MKKIREISILAAVLAMAGCEKDTVPTVVPDGAPILFSERSASFTVEGATRDRDGEDPDSYTVIPPTTLGVYGEMEGYLSHIFTSDLVFYHKDGPEYDRVRNNIEGELGEDIDLFGDNPWIYAPLKYWVHENKYQFYAFAPHFSHDNVTVAMDNTLYGALKEMTITEIPPFSDVNYMVADSYKEANKGTVVFNMKNISARLCVRLKIGEYYSRIRTVKITNVSINDRDIGATYYTCKSKFTDNPADHKMSIIPQGAYSNENGVINLIRIFEDPEGLELSPEDYKQYGSLYTMPQEVPSVTVNVTYDVYDRDGNRVRKDQKVSNTHILRKQVESGKYYNINIVVSPTYLYVLSDDDGERPDILLDVDE